MREYLFRGKRKGDKEWQFGHLHIIEWDKPAKAKGDYIDYRILGRHNECSYVDPETVGQYTGLTDKNGVRIFEGDIVRTQPFFDKPYSKKAKSTQHIGVVEYIAGDTGAEWRVRIEDYIGYGHCAFSAFHNCEVIGNIYDNSELLKEGGEE